MSDHVKCECGELVSAETLRDGKCPACGAELSRTSNRDASSAGGDPTDATPGPWRCPNCGEDVDGSFDACWNCGTGRDGAPPDEQFGDAKSVAQEDLPDDGEHRPDAAALPRPPDQEEGESPGPADEVSSLRDQIEKLERRLVWLEERDPWEGLPETELLSENFLGRAFAVWGLWLVMNIVFGLGGLFLLLLFFLGSKCIR